MRVLLLGPSRPSIESCLERHGDDYRRTEAPLLADSPYLCDSDFLVSYGYRHLLKPDLLALFGTRAVNLHISLLPWNRGADPNLWSYLDDTPRGVTIHVLDPGLDTGPILVQEVVEDNVGDTLATSYARLSARIEALFCQNWEKLRSGALPARPQNGVGSEHRSADKEPFASLLTAGWDTPVAELIGKADTHAGGSGRARFEAGGDCGGS